MNIKELLPLTVDGNRIYAANGEEIAVATKASPKHRAHANETASFLAFAGLLYEACTEWLGHYDGFVRDGQLGDEPGIVLMRAVVDVIKKMESKP